MSCSSTAFNPRTRTELAFLGVLHSCLLARTGGIFHSLMGVHKGDGVAFIIWHQISWRQLTCVSLFIVLFLHCIAAACFMIKDGKEREVCWDVTLVELGGRKAIV
jgi:hypothetical protein